jgi:hypothetical protein
LIVTIVEILNNCNFYLLRWLAVAQVADQWDIS